jgi:hypothetical protein
MKKLVVVALVLFAFAAFAGEVVKRGAPISSETAAVPLASVLEKPEEYTKAPVVIEGVVAAACQTRGCWMQIAPTASEAGIRVTFKDYAFFVPLDSKGRAARMEGTVEVKTLSKADVDHLVGEGAKLKRNPDGTANEVSFVASGVELTGK